MHDVGNFTMGGMTRCGRARGMGQASAAFTPCVAVVRRAICVLLLASVATVGWADTSAQAQEPPPDLTEARLEELLEIEVIPINVMGTHIHLAGEWMIGYKYMFMRMDGNRDGTDRLSADEVLQDFRVAPTDMNMEMHMVEVMYGVTDDLTLMAMLPYKRLSMDHVTGPLASRVRFTTESEGIGDVQMMGHYSFYKRDPHQFILMAALSIPTGSIDEKDFLADPAQGKKKLPYPMQLGSGTFDLLPGITYLGQTENWNWGTHVMGTIRLGENSNDYRLGNRLHLTAWGTRKLTGWLSLSARIDGQIWENIHGADPDLDPTLVPTADPDRRAGARLDLLPGINLYVPRGPLKGLRFAVEGGVPIYQSLDGPQLETDWLLTVEAQYVF